MFHCNNVVWKYRMKTESENKLIIKFGIFFYYVTATLLVNCIIKKPIQYRNCVINGFGNLYEFTQFFENIESSLFIILQSPFTGTKEQT